MVDLITDLITTYSECPACKTSNIDWEAKPIDKRETLFDLRGQCNSCRDILSLSVPVTEKEAIALIT